MGATPRKRISIVTPCYNEEDGIRICYETVARIFAEKLPEYDYEHIFTDNASTDRTVEILKEIAAQDPRVRIIVNSRNFGPTNSLFNGILNADGDAVLTMLAADLQDPPELIPEFVHHWEAGYEVVYGVRAKREEHWSMVLARKTFYAMVSAFADFSIPRNAGEFQLVDRIVIEALRKHEDYFPYVRGLLASCGFRALGIRYTWRKREQGASKAWTLSLIDQALNGMISFSKVPMRCCMALGLLVALITLGFSLVLFVRVLMVGRGDASPGIPTLVVGLFFLGAVQLFFLGVIGEYVMATHFQVRKRPLVIERERVNFGPRDRIPIPSFRAEEHRQTG